MAKYVRKIIGDFNEVLSFCDDAIKNGSMSASYEDGSYYQSDIVKVSVNVYERYSMMGSNRVSLSLTLVGEGNNLFLTAITSGGSEAIFFKINTFGEDSFLDTLIEEVENRYPEA